jgi:hypothetical protein
VRPAVPPNGLTLFEDAQVNIRNDRSHFEMF